MINIVKDRIAINFDFNYGDGLVVDELATPDVAGQFVELWKEASREKDWISSPASACGYTDCIRCK